MVVACGLAPMICDLIVLVCGVGVVYIVGCWCYYLICLLLLRYYGYDLLFRVVGYYLVGGVVPGWWFAAVL